MSRQSILTGTLATRGLNLQLYMIVPGCVWCTRSLAWGERTQTFNVLIGISAWIMFGFVMHPRTLQHSRITFHLVVPRAKGLNRGCWMAASCTLKRMVKDQTVCFVKAFEVLMMIWSSDAHDALCPRVCYCHGGKLTRRQPQKLLPYGWPRQCLRTAALTFVQRKWYKSVPMIYLLQANYPRLLSWIY